MTFRADELEAAFGALLRGMRDELAVANTRWMLIGGLAVSAWTEPRGTKDCDVALAVPADIVPLESALARIGLVPFRGELAHVRDGGVVRLKVARGSEPPLVVDLLCAGTDFENEALGNARSTTVLGVEVPIVAPDDLLLYKLIAGRPQDLADIDKLIRFGRAPADEARVRRWAREWDCEAALDRALDAARRDP